MPSKRSVTAQRELLDSFANMRPQIQELNAVLGCLTMFENPEPHTADPWTGTDSCCQSKFVSSAEKRGRFILVNCSVIFCPSSAGTSWALGSSAAAAAACSDAAWSRSKLSIASSEWLTTAQPGTWLLRIPLCALLRVMRSQYWVPAVKVKNSRLAEGTVHRDWIKIQKHLKAKIEAWKFSFYFVLMSKCQQREPHDFWTNTHNYGNRAAGQIVQPAVLWYWCPHETWKSVPRWL